MSMTVQDAWNNAHFDQTSGVTKPIEHLQVSKGVRTRYTDGSVYHAYFNTMDDINDYVDSKRLEPDVKSVSVIITYHN